MSAKVDVVIKSNQYIPFADAAQGLADEALTEVAADIEQTAEGIVPVDTGELQESIYSELVEPGVAEAGATADHATFVEFGTRNQAAQPYLIPAFEEIAPSTPERIAEKFGEFFR